jgi:hypothetical protein
MSDNHHRYEIFVKSIIRQMNLSLTTATWSWSRLSESGSILVHGGDHGSLEACFASARRHRTQFGPAPISINLQKSHVAVAPSAPETLAVKDDALITNLAAEYAHTGELRVQMVVEKAREPTKSVAVLQNRVPSAEAA